MGPCYGPRGICSMGPFEDSRWLEKIGVQIREPILRAHRKTLGAIPQSIPGSATLMIPTPT